jgi:hypothetical protein
MHFVSGSYREWKYVHNHNWSCVCLLQIDMLLHSVGLGHYTVTGYFLCISWTRVLVNIVDLSEVYILSRNSLFVRYFVRKWIKLGFSFMQPVGYTGMMKIKKWNSSKSFHLFRRWNLRTDGRTRPPNYGPLIFTLRKAHIKMGRQRVNFLTSCFCSFTLTYLDGMYSRTRL